ncbi:APC family permease (plasmid) [Halococcus dombrowskii]|uniref:APC family permease n=1 Tax=Halococcus dombrowskii TaxID=179637 RepID=A0AAV3SE90_HALDO|nr:APC family permease [Halococcus dombrowskii]UOO96821.1 APC family permease [Halococcus dombrowskii]
MPARTDGGATTEFSRTIGLQDLLLMSIGGMIGPAVFYYPAVTSRQAGPAAVLAWLAAGVGMTAIALCYTELATAFPREGGPAVFPAETLGKRPIVGRFFAYIEGVCYVIGWTFGISISAWFVTTYFGQLPGLGGIAGHTVVLPVVAVAASFVVTLFGINLTKRTTLVLTAFILAVLVFLVAAGLGDLKSASGGFTPFFTGSASEFFGMMGVTLSAYGAWTVIPASAEEIKRPAWTIPRAILGSLLAVTLLYTVMMIVFIAVIPTASITADSTVLFAPLSVLAVNVGIGTIGQYLVPLAALVAIFTTMLIGISSSARVLVAMGRQGLLPKAFTTVSTRSGTPVVSVAIVAVAALGLVLVRGLYDQIVLASLVGTVLPYAINVLSLIGLRRYRTDVTPTFEAPGGMALPAIALIFLGLMVIGLGVEQPFTAVLVLCGVIFTFIILEIITDSSSPRTVVESDD